MAVIPSSPTDVFTNLVEFFSKLTGNKSSTFTLATDVRNNNNFSPGAWVELRTDLANLDWMKHFGIRLSPKQMDALSTLADMTSVIWAKIQVIAGKGAVIVAPLQAAASKKLALKSFASAKAGLRKRRPKKTKHGNKVDARK